MFGVRRPAVVTVVVPVLLAAACSSPGDLAIRNESVDVVTVLLGDEETEVLAGGAVVVLGHGCTPGDVDVVFAAGGTITLSGPVCPDQQIEIDRTGQVFLAAAEEHAP